MTTTTTTTALIPSAESDAAEAMAGLKTACTALINLSDTLWDDDQEFLAEDSHNIKMDLLPLMHRLNNLLFLIKQA